MPDLAVLHLVCELALVGERLRARQRHCMPPSLLGSQFEALEPLGDERGLSVLVEEVLAELLAEIVRL